MAIRILKRCTKCGILNRWSETRNTCIWCNNTTYTEIEYQDFLEEEEDLIDNVGKKILYILDKSFNTVQPTEDSLFGCIEMCDYLKNKYNLGNDVYELIGVINRKLPSLEHAKYVTEYAKASGRQVGITLEDGRRIDYTLVFYSSAIENERSEYDACSQEDIEAIESDTKAELKYIIDIIAKLKPCTTGRMDYEYPSADIDFNLEVMKKARTHVMDFIKPQRDLVKTNNTRNQIVEEMTKPVKNTDPNYVESATCPNCNKKSVYRISNIKRGASIGLFGLFSKDIGKTMECRSCGYKW